MAERAPAEPQYRIGTAASLTGLSTHVIRIWERRYSALVPQRSAGGARLYSEAELERLRLLRRAVEAGHAISQVAPLSNDRLERLVGPETSAPATASAFPSNDGESNRFVEDFLAAVHAFDVPRAEAVLAQASMRFSPRVLVVERLGPVLQRIGDSWASGNLCVASEHVASALVRNLLGSLLRQYTPASSAETIVVTTLAGELHEFGALMTAVTAAMHGLRALYLGANLPADQIAEATRGSGARVVAVSIIALEVRVAVRQVEQLRQELPPSVRVLLGGQGAWAVQKKLASSVEACATLADFERWLSENVPRERDRSAR